MYLQGCKLTYFPIPGRAETIRLALTIGGIAFTDERINFKDWSTLKPSTPWGSLPVLTLSNGQAIAQQRAILRMIGKEVDLYPQDGVQAAFVDCLMDACEDIGTKTNSLGQGLPKEEKEAARAKAVAKGGAVYDLVDKLEKFVGENGTDGYAVGDQLTIADLAIFANFGTLVSGLYDGVPLDAVDSDFPKTLAIRKKVRSHAAIEAWYGGLDPSIKIPPSFGPFN
jgi:glutathione S-transferase